MMENCVKCRVLKVIKFPIPCNIEMFGTSVFCEKITVIKRFRMV